MKEYERHSLLPREFAGAFPFQVDICFVFFIVTEALFPMVIPSKSTQHLDVQVGSIRSIHIKPFKSSFSDVFLSKTRIWGFPKIGLPQSSFFHGIFQI